MGKHHTYITKEFAESVTLWLLSGSPGRTYDIYDRFLSGEIIENSRSLPVAKGYIERKIKGQTHRILVGAATTGMGMNSTEVTMHGEVLEVAALANPGQIVTGIRVGTAGSHKHYIHGEDLVISREVYTPFGAIDDLIVTPHENPEYHIKLANLLKQGQSPATSDSLRQQVDYEIAKLEIFQAPSCDEQVISYIEEASRRLGLNNCHTGPVFSKQTLLNESIDTFLFKPEGIREKRLRDRVTILKDLVLVSEMEEAMLTSIAYLARQGGYSLKIGGIMAVINNPKDPSQSVNPLFVNRDRVAIAVNSAIELALETAVVKYINENKSFLASQAVSEPTIAG